MTSPTGYAPFDTVGVKYVTSIPDNPDPSVVYMLWDGVDYKSARRVEVSGGKSMSVTFGTAEPDNDDGMPDGNLYLKYTE